MDAIKTLKTALKHAKFQDPDIQAASDKLLDKLSDELNAAGYDAGSEVEEAADDLDATITAYEETLETAPVTQVASDDDDDPFAGLEDPDAV